MRLRLENDRDLYGKDFVTISKCFLLFRENICEDTFLGAVLHLAAKENAKLFYISGWDDLPFPFKKIVRCVVSFTTFTQGPVRALKRG